jgi:hypothetical protein
VGLAHPGGVIAVVVVALLAAFISTDPMVAVLHSLTGGAPPADITVGIVLVVVPPAAALLLARMCRTRGLPAAGGAYALALWAAAVALSPYAKGTVIDPSLLERERSRLPRLTTGLTLGWYLAVLLGLVYGALWLRHTLLKDSAARRRRPRPPVRAGRIRSRTNLPPRC